MSDARQILDLFSSRRDVCFTVNGIVDNFPLLKRVWVQGVIDILLELDIIEKVVVGNYFCYRFKAKDDYELAERINGVLSF
jgi:hypothetical protein